MTDVAIYTDASIYEGVGAWAAVIIRDECEPVEHSGKLRGRFESSTAVEAAAMANALHRAALDRLVRPGDTVTLFCDNDSAVQRIMNGNQRKCERTIRKAIAYVLDLGRHLGVQLEARWVKGHQRLDSHDVHMLYNRRCDELCGAARTGRDVQSFADLRRKVTKARERRAAGKGSKVERELWARQDAQAARS